MSLLSVLVVGFLLGIQHATEADHLAAVATLATRRAGWADALRQGAAWGLGHTAALLLFGGLVLALGRRIPPQLEQALEFCVGLMLVGLGFDVLRRLWRDRIHVHAHAHGDAGLHLHAHSHAGEPRAQAGAVPAFAQLRFVLAPGAGHHALEHRHDHPQRLPARALLVGTMHGMAGSAALILLSLGGASSVASGLLYILLFGLGSILGMAALCAVIALPLRASAAALGGLHRGLHAAVGLLSCGLGLWMVYRIGLVEGLLRG